MNRPESNAPPAPRQPIDIGATLRAFQSAGRLDQYRTRRPIDSWGELLDWYRRDGWPEAVADALRELEPAETLAWLRAAGRAA